MELFNWVLLSPPGSTVDANVKMARMRFVTRMNRSLLEMFSNTSE